MEMAIRASMAAKYPPSTSSSSSLLPCKPRASLSLPKSPPKTKTQPRPTSASLPASVTISLLSLLSPHDAKALTVPKDQIMSSLTEVEKTIGQVQEVGSTILDTTQQVFQVVANALKPGIDAAMPLLQQAGEEALKTASPAFSEASRKAQDAMQSSGFDTEPVFSAAKTVAGAAQQTSKVIEDARPLASSTVETISSASPTVIAGTAGALFLAYLLLPPIWSAISFNFRGYKGELTPAQTLDLMCSRNHFLIDIRSEKDKDKAGIPRLPSSAKNKMIPIPLEELPSKLRGIVRNSKKVEAEIAALKVSYLKKLNKGSNIVIMDSYSDSAKIVARTLTSLGFKNCWIVTDGFSGGRGWLQSRLGTDSYNFSFAEVFSPSRVIPAAARRFGTTASTMTVRGGKFLPGAD